MLTSVPPWLQSGPQLILDAAQSGAKLGMSAADALNQHNLGLAQISARAAESANQIGAERERASAALALQAAEHERAQQNTLANLGLEAGRLDVSKGHLSVEQQRVQQAEAAAKAKGIFGNDIHIGNKVVRKNPDGTITVLFDANEKSLDPLDRAEFNQAVKNRAKADEMLKNTKMSPAEAALWQKQLQDAETTMTNIKEKFSGKFAPTAGAFQPPAVPASPQQFPFGKPISLDDPQASDWQKNITGPAAALFNKSGAVNNDPAGLFK